MTHLAPASPAPSPTLWSEGIQQSGGDVRLDATLSGCLFLVQRGKASCDRVVGWSQWGLMPRWVPYSCRNTGMFRLGHHCFAEELAAAGDRPWAGDMALYALPQGMLHPWR